MARNPRPALAIFAAVDFVALLIVIYYQLNGQPQLAPLTGMLTALFAAFLAALIALSTIDYLTERGQIRGWIREETLKALEPVYEEIVANIASFREFNSGSTVAWETLHKQSRRLRVPQSLAPRLRKYYEDVQSHWRSRSGTYQTVKDSVYGTYEKEFGSKIPNKTHQDISGLVMQTFSEIVDGDLDRLLQPRNMDVYQKVYTNVASGAPVRPSGAVLRELKETISKDPAVVTLRKVSEDLVKESEALLEQLRPVLLRSWEFGD